MITTQDTQWDILAATVQQDKLIRDWTEIRRKVDHSLCLALVTMRKLWNELILDEIWELYKKSPWCQQSDFSYYFEHYAQFRLGCSWITIVNYLRIAKVWLDPATQIEMPIVQPLNPETGKPTAEPEQFDPWEIDATKLLVATTKAEQGQMTSEEWGLLANPEASWSQVHLAISGKALPWESQSKIIEAKSLFIEGGILWVQEGREAYPMFSVELEEENSLTMWAFQHIISKVGIKIR